MKCIYSTQSHVIKALQLMRIYYKYLCIGSTLDNSKSMTKDLR